MTCPHILPEYDQSSVSSKKFALYFLKEIQVIIE